jgi:hypothetical protein
MKSIAVVEGGAGVELAGPGTSHLAAAARHHDEHGHLRAVLVRAGHAEAALRFHGLRRTLPCSSSIWLPRVPWKLAWRWMYEDGQPKMGKEDCRPDLEGVKRRP